MDNDKNDQLKENKNINVRLNEINLKAKQFFKYY